MSAYLAETCNVQNKRVGMHYNLLSICINSIIMTKQKDAWLWSCQTRIRFSTFSIDKIKENGECSVDSSILLI